MTDFRLDFGSDLTPRHEHYNGLRGVWFRRLSRRSVFAAAATRFGLICALLGCQLGLVGHAVGAELQVGDQAPDFELQASDGKTYRLSDYRGKQAVVLAWFPRAFTSGCTVECKSLAKNGDRIREYDVSYFMASTDPVETNADFADETNADFPLLSDEGGDVATAYGVYTRGFARRYTFYIDIEGRISMIDRKVKPSTSAADMVTNLQELSVALRP